MNSKGRESVDVEVVAVDPRASDPQLSEEVSALPFALITRPGVARLLISRACARSRMAGDEDGLGLQIQRRETRREGRAREGDEG